MASPAPQLDFQPEDPAFYQRDPDAAFARLRAEDRLHWHPPGRFWCVTSHADLQEVSRRPRLFCSSRGTQLFEVLPQTPLMPEHSDVPPNIIRMDPPVHNIHRKLVMGSFTPARIAAMEPLVRKIARRSLDAIDPRSPVDFMAQRAVPMPMVVIANMLGGPEIGMFCMTLLVAGNETTRNLVSGGALALMRHPEQREALLADPALLTNALEEMLRYVSPIRNFVRNATQDTKLHGSQVREGDYLVFFYSSANRDEKVFGPDADAFNIHRKTARRHVAFGFGEHLCLGASLARLEGRVMFEELFARWPRFELAGEPEPLMSNLMNGFVHIPVTLEP